MSGASKRLQEEGSNPTTSKRPLEETGLFSSLSGKLIQSVANDFHLPFEPGEDGRLAKVQRIESRFVDKRTSLLHRMSSSSNNSCLDHTYTSENRLELREIKDARDFRTEKRETKAETRELNTEPTVDPLSSKADDDTRPDNRVDEKELRSDRQSHSDFKGVSKLEKDSYSAPNCHLKLKEPKEHHRFKRYSEFPSDSLDTWRVSRHVLHSTDGVRKDISTAEEQDSLEAHEAVGENKVDLKGEDKFRDKDSKRKDEKRSDWAEREKERNDRRNNLLLGGPSNERKEMVREEKDVDKWERERKDALKDKERKDMEKEPIKRELPNASEKESLHNDKELVDGSVKILEQENTMLEPKGLRDDGWKALGRELNDKKRERDVDIEGDTPEKRNRCYDKESDDGCGDGVTERDIEAFGYGVHQRRRMLRSRGTPQTPHREPRFRSRARHNEGSQGIVEVSTIVYKAGLCMQELLKSWKEFEASQDDKNEGSMQNGPTLEIRIPAEYVIATNRQVRGGQLWGTDVYTNDSDLVAVLMHTGYCRPTSSPPPSSISELRATIRVLPPQDCYTSTLRNNVRSRAWGAGIGCSFRVERCCIVKKGGGTISLEPRLTHISAVEPTLAPVSVERTMTTRSAASNTLRQQRCVREVTIQYNLCNEPWLKYSISIVADKGLKKPLYTSARLKKGEVLYLETHFKRYELCFNGEKAACNGTTSASSQSPGTDLEKRPNHNLHAQTGDRNPADRENIVDVFRWSRCKKPLPQAVMRSIGIPLPTEHLEVLEESLDWEEIQWSQAGVWVAGKEYALARVHFLSPN